MAKIEIGKSLYEEILKKFKGDSVNVLRHLKSLEKTPEKGKTQANIAGIVIKELKYKGFQFYFLVDGFKLKIHSEQELVDMLLRFVRMSSKKHQQQTIEEIRNVLLKIGPEGFE